MTGKTLTDDQIDSAYTQFVLDSQEVCRDCGCVSECLCIGLMAAGNDPETRKIRYAPMWICWRCAGARA